MGISNSRSGFRLSLDELDKIQEGDEISRITAFGFGWHYGVLLYKRTPILSSVVTNFDATYGLVAKPFNISLREFLNGEKEVYITSDTYKLEHRETLDIVKKKAAWSIENILVYDLYGSDCQDYTISLMVKSQYIKDYTAITTVWMTRIGRFNLVQNHAFIYPYCISDYAEKKDNLADCLEQTSIISTAHLIMDAGLAVKPTAYS
jgi:hypothetical protein